MSNDTNDDVEIIRAAYADKVKEAFIAFADNLSTGQQEQACRVRFLRAIELVRKARNLALVALSDPQGAAGEGEEASVAQHEAEALSAEDQALVDSVLAGTTGARRVPPPPSRFGKS